MPALGVAQDTGRVLRWLRAEGELVTKGEPLIEVETDKVTVELDARGLLGWQRLARERSGARITVTDVLVRVVAHALAEHPALGVSWSADGLVAGGGIGIGLAVALDDGLVVPVIRDADGLGLA